MSLENRVNKALNHLKSFKSRLVSNAKKAAYMGLISLALAGTIKSAEVETSNNFNIKSNNNYSWTNPNNSQDELIPKSELGYVIQTGSESDINSLNNMLNSSENVELKQIGGAGHKNLSISYSNSPNKSENEKTIKSLKAHNQVRYAAPLFSANGETIAVIPEIVARVKNEADYSRLEELCRKSDLIITKRMDFTKKEYLIEVLGNDANAVFESVNVLNNTKFIEWASPNIAFQPKLCNEQEPKQLTPNDTFYKLQWHLNNTGQSEGTPNADINAPEAWAVLGGGGDSNITIAVLGTGVDCNHPDLIDNIVQGYDFYDNDNFPDPSENDAHETAVAGIVAAKGNNSIGVAGVAYDCKLMPIRILSSGNFITQVDLAKSIRWAAENDADIINCSWGTLSDRMPIVHSAVVDVTTSGGIGRKGKGCVVLASSGNGESLFGFTSILFPARYPEVIAIGATDHNDDLWGYSSYGPELSLVAPSGNRGWSGNIWTTDLVGRAGVDQRSNYTNKMGGTSAACPVASGIAALVLSANPELTNKEVRRILSRSAKNLLIPGWDQYSGHGRVDAYSAVKLALNPPEPFLFVDDNAINDPLSGNSDVSDPLEDGSTEHPFDSIQEAINRSTPGDTVIVLPGIYTGTNNYNLNFLGKAITVRSMNGPKSCIVDCQKSGRGFYFQRGEKADSMLDGFTLINGYADYGGSIRCYDSSPTIINCILTNNSASIMGGGMMIEQSNPTITNCILTNNSASLHGGGIENWYTDLILTNCTFNGNYAGIGGGMTIFSSPNNNLKTTNCIFWGNTPDEIFMADGNPEKPEITYTDIRGGWSGLSNIDKDPLFADPNNGDYHLKSQAGRWDPKNQTWVKDDITSPCIDAGDPNTSIGLEPMPNGEKINMGAYGGTPEASKSPYNPADLNNDGTVNLKDFAIFAGYWKRAGNSQPADLNKDEKVDATDLGWLTGDWLKEKEQYKAKF